MIQNYSMDCSLNDMPVADPSIMFHHELWFNLVNTSVLT